MDWSTFEMRVYKTILTVYSATQNVGGGKEAVEMETAQGGLMSGN